ncbi:MAG: hypothetical protein LBS20_19440 [Prevotella sp.]|jgi:exonuclease V gamma subunit|nr:hypothetical protein [Prevotella sp.]
MNTKEVLLQMLINKHEGEEVTVELASQIQRELQQLLPDFETVTERNEAELKAGDVVVLKSDFDRMSPQVIAAICPDGNRAECYSIIDMKITYEFIPLVCLKKINGSE